MICLFKIAVFWTPDCSASFLFAWANRHLPSITFHGTVRPWRLDRKNSLVILDAAKWNSGTALWRHAAFPGAELGLGRVLHVRSSFDTTQPVGSFFDLGGGLSLEHPPNPVLGGLHPSPYHSACPLLRGTPESSLWLGTVLNYTELRIHLLVTSRSR